MDPDPWRALYAHLLSSMSAKSSLTICGVCEVEIYRVYGVCGVCGVCVCWSGLLTNVWDEDTTAIMQKLLSERQKPAAMREPPFRRAVFLNVVMDPQENLNPWWILFGYVPDRDSWQAVTPAITPLKGSMVSRTPLTKRPTCTRRCFRSTPALGSLAIVCVG